MRRPILALTRHITQGGQIEQCSAAETLMSPFVRECKQDCSFHSTWSQGTICAPEKREFSENERLNEVMSSHYDLITKLISMYFKRQTVQMGGIFQRKPDYLDLHN